MCKVKYASKYFLQSEIVFLKLEYMQISVMWCPEISGDFPSCVLGGCVLFGFCFVFGAGAKTFFSFIFLVDLKHGAICKQF